MDFDLLGLGAVLCMILLVAIVIWRSSFPEHIRMLLLAGLALRVGGSQLYLFVTESFFGGVADYGTYYWTGLAWLQAWLNGESATFSTPYLRPGEICCTAFTIRLTGVIAHVVGGSLHGLFLVYAVFSYVGIVALAIAFVRSFPRLGMVRYLMWVVLFPSLWYWPAALGKDALVLGGLGLAVLGFIGYRGKTGWLALGGGMIVLFMVRPQLATLVVTIMAAAHWIGSTEQMNTARVMQGFALVGFGLFVGWLAGQTMGFNLFSLTEVESYVEARGSSSAYGGSAVDVTGPISGIVNVLFRPFLWEARSIPSIISALELAFFWFLVVWKRESVAQFVREHRKTRLFWFAGLFVLSYVILIGMTMGNLGLIARQRVHLFPFILMFICGISRMKVGRGTSHARAYVPLSQ